MSETDTAQELTLRQRMWKSKPLRGALVTVPIIVGVLVPTPVGEQSAKASDLGATVELQAAAGCTDTEIRNNMTCTTDPKITKCILNTAGAFAVGWVGGPLGAVAGVAGGVISCLTDRIG